MVGDAPQRAVTAQINVPYCLTVKVYHEFISQDPDIRFGKEGFIRNPVIVHVWASWVYILARAWWWSPDNAEAGLRLLGFTQGMLYRTYAEFCGCDGMADARFNGIQSTPGGLKLK